MKIVESIKKNTILLLLITIVVLYLVLKDNLDNIAKSFRNIDLKFIIIAIILYYISVCIRGFVNYLIVNDKKKLSIKEAIKHNLIIQFFNGITPFSTGGEPMEIYMLTEHNISLPKATNYSVQSFLFYQVSLVICGVIAVAYNYIFHIFPKIQILQKLVLLGFIINIIVITILLLVSTSKKASEIIKKIIINFCKLFKIKINEKNLDKKFEDYYEGFKDISNNKLICIGILLNIIGLSCLYITPLFVAKAMGVTNLTGIETITASAYVYLIGAFVPIPGASGGIEYGFTQFYGIFIGLEKISAVLIVWRFITYYLGIIVGAIAFNIDRRVHEK